MAAIAVLLGAAALVVALTRPTSNSSGASAATSTTPTFTADQTASAHKKLCDTYKLAAQSVAVETNGTDKALARLALSNAAGMLDNAIDNPALESKYRDPAQALAASYLASNAIGSVSADAEYRAALDDIVAKDAAMKQVCANGGG